MAAYARALHNVALAGPTLFGPVINTAAQIAGQSISYNSSKYFVLLIITVKRMLNQIYFVCDKLLFLLKQMRHFMSQDLYPKLSQRGFCLYLMPL